jgi:uncharacterized protein (TIGR02246 family)
VQLDAPSSLPPADEAAIRSLFADVVTAWNAGDAAGFASAFAPDADFVNVYGMHERGRDVIQRAHAFLFGSIFAGSTNRYDVRSIRALSRDVVIVHIEASLNVPSGPMAGLRRALPSAVLTRTSGGWTIAAFQNTLITPPPVTVPT